MVRQNYSMLGDARMASSAFVLSLVIALSMVEVAHSLLSPALLTTRQNGAPTRTIQNLCGGALEHREASPIISMQSVPSSSSSDAGPSPSAQLEDPADTSSPTPLHHNLLASYSLYWDNLLQREHRETVIEQQQLRKSYTASQLEASGLAIIFNAVASPESELYGEKIVRVTVLDADERNGGRRARSGTSKKLLRDKFKRGDVLVLTPLISFRGKDDLPPREGLVVDVGSDFLTLGIGTGSWPAGMMEMRKHHDYYRVRLDRSASTVPLRAQRVALDKLRRGAAGTVASLFVEMFYGGESSRSRQLLLGDAGAVPTHFDDGSDLQQMIACAMKEAVAEVSFEPNESQQDAVSWALGRKISLIRGPPGTGKTRCAALLISTALKMKVRQPAVDNAEGESDPEKEGVTGTPRTPRVLAVTHSNGAADVLLQALIQMGVPAVRAGRPASVSPSIQHRTIAALSERMPAVVDLRQQAGDASLDRQTRQSATYDLAKSMADAQTMIAKSAPVVVASCIGAQQLLSSLGEVGDDVKSSFPIVVLDEAAQTTEPALICALAAAKASQVVLVGDTRQLPPTVTTQDVELRKTIGVSPMERLLKNGCDEFVLKEQYRMPQALLGFPNEYFYDSVVKCAATGGADSSLPPPKGFPWPSAKNEPLALLEIGNDSEVAHNFGGRTNPQEVEIIVDIVRSVIAAGDVKAENIAIITPYSKQAQLFRTELDNASLRNGEHSMSDVQIGTVDSYQGREVDLTIFSAVRSNLLKELGFLRDARRLNVAITRARRGLIIVGDPTVLRTCRHWAALLDSCADRGCTLTKSEYNDHAMKELILAGATSKKNAINPSSLELDMEDEYYGLF